MGTDKIAGQAHPFHDEKKPHKTQIKSTTTKIRSDIVGKENNRLHKKETELIN